MEKGMSDTVLDNKQIIGQWRSEYETVSNYGFLLHVIWGYSHINNFLKPHHLNYLFFIKQRKLFNFYHSFHIANTRITKDVTVLNHLAINE